MSLRRIAGCKRLVVEPHNGTVGPQETGAAISETATKIKQAACTEVPLHFSVPRLVECEQRFWSLAFDRPLAG